jgi:hypothetical protein
MVVSRAAALAGDDQVLAIVRPSLPFQSLEEGRPNVLAARTRASQERGGADWTANRVSPLTLIPRSAVDQTAIDRT